jgi:hypothetical protein
MLRRKEFIEGSGNKSAEHSINKNKNGTLMLLVIWKGVGICSYLLESKEKDNPH